MMPPLIHTHSRVVRRLLELAIEPGTPPRAIARDIEQAGVRVDSRILFAWFRLSGKVREIKAGNYEIPSGTTPLTLLDKLVRGEESLRSLTLLEGWTFRQVRAALAREEALKHDTATLTDADLMELLGRPGVHPEGRFFPDTYTYAKGSSELAVLRRALHSMDRRLEAAWAQRASDTPLKTADEALILASIVEKETGRAADRAQIAGVFSNRLRNGMLLQTDPTVIYGLGDKFDGNLRRKDLQTYALEHLHPCGPAAHVHRHAWQGIAAGRGATRTHTRPVFCGAGRWFQPFQRLAGRAQSRRQPFSTRPVPMIRKPAA